ncbi:flagellar protein FliT [Clostridium sartagoforme]|uniref:Flagellar protein FliT n=1 Tax=Clostridium sartagoforme TaxID=84031 RepID=A0A4S2DRG4_9CLOT|nr:flagellar protein FliT [Clostridium sartagoforme]TGY43783.1 flagellar protein FliT [Clostridium sartagoforme]
MILEKLKEYKEITLSIINGIENEEEALRLIDKRKKILDNLFSNEDNIEEIKKAYLELDLIDLDKKLKEAIEKEIILVKGEIRNLHNIKNANNAYEKNRRVNNFFTAKI